MNYERSIKAVPIPILLLLLIGIACQFIYKQSALLGEVEYTPLRPSLTINHYKVMSLGSIKLWAHLLTLQLQLHDNQKGRHINYRYLDYDVLSQQLLMLQKLNKDSDYTAKLAGRVFVNTSDNAQLKKILMTTIELFEANPELNWRWIAESTVLAKYHLNDVPLALLMAKTIAKQPKSMAIPAWARDLEFLMLEELNQLEAAIYIVEKTLEDSDSMIPDERRFLQNRLSILKQKTVDNSTQ